MFENKEMLTVIYQLFSVDHLEREAGADACAAWAKDFREPEAAIASKLLIILVELEKYENAAQSQLTALQWLTDEGLLTSEQLVTIIGLLNQNWGDFEWAGEYLETFQEYLSYQ